MKSFTTNVYTFDELSDDAKEKAIENHRYWNVEHDWWEFVYEDASTVAKHLGFQLGGYNWATKREERAFCFSGFSSQGDGACFYRATFNGPVSLKDLKAYAPKDKELHQIARDLQRFYSPFKSRDLAVSIKHSGHYCHERSMDYSYEVAEESRLTGLAFKRKFSIQDENLFEEACRDFCRWLYKQLQAEYDHLTSDDVVSKSLMANECLFCVCGKDFTPCGDSVEVTS